MIGKQSKRQTGLALLLFLLIMMGLGGIALTGFTQKALKQVEDKRFSHNERVLKEAKQALLMFAYNYPTTHPGQGPGRLPCPYDQIPDGGSNGYSTGGPSNDICNDKVGRLPWGHTYLKLPEFKDADGEHLWYAVSKDFDNNATPIINSDTTGTISIKDQTGNVMYDGSISGIAAVIIAPGPAIAIDDDNSGSLNYQQVRNRNDKSDAVNFDPKNFLDSAYGENNSDFDNSTLNGFILGPIVDGNNTLLINDQIIIIRAEEVISMAEKATLDAYRTAINDYLTSTTPPNVYPWLFNYNVSPVCVNEVPAESETTEALCIANGGEWSTIELSSKYTAHNNFTDEITNELSNIGRIPSMFQGYFTEANSQPIESKLSGSIEMSYPLQPTEVDYSYDPPGSGSGSFEFVSINDLDPPTHTLTFQTVNKLDEVMFVDLAPDGHGQLKGTVTVDEPLEFSHTIFFWDSLPPSGPWKMCGGGANVVSNCNRNIFGGPDPFGLINYTSSTILKITLTMDWDVGDVVNFDTDYGTPPVVLPPIAASISGHSQVSGTFDGAAVIALPPLTASFQIDNAYFSGDTTFEVSSSGILDDLADLTFGPLTLSLRYYPELPIWTFDNRWHNSIMMAYAPAYGPNGTGTCTEGTDCIAINGFPGKHDNKKSILIIAGEHDWVDGDAAPQPVAGPDTLFTDEVDDIFNLENSDFDGTFDIRSVGDASALGDTQLDKILVIDEL
ncbi:MAG: hypothetical protein ACJA0I_001839 [Gammaproteobacteria bacterium]|jgi:hypothetical protein